MGGDKEWRGKGGETGDGPREAGRVSESTESPDHVRHPTPKYGNQVPTYTKGLAVPLESA